VDTITWFRVHDQLPDPSFAATTQSGVFFEDGRAKLAARAFGFPFVAERANRRSLRVWGRSPRTGRLVIERRTGARWRSVRTLSVRRHATFFLRVTRRTGRDRLRARVEDQRSLTWVVR
jgi:hypothetical protein